jgi:hypothetical protein
MPRYYYAGIPKKMAVQQKPGESYNYNPPKGTYNTDVEHPELKEFLEKADEEQADEEMELGMLSMKDLVKRAQAKGIDTQGKKKADLIEMLNE